MNSLEKILNYIEENTKKEIEKIKNEHTIECEKILDSAKLKAKEDYEATIKKIETKKNELRRNFQFEMQQTKKEVITKKIDEILKRTIDLALKILCEDEKEKYIDFIKKLLTKNLPKNSATIVFGKKDYDIFSDILEEKIEIKKSENFEHGFKIVCEKYILNYDIKTILSQTDLTLKAIAKNALNMEEIII